MDYRSFTEWMFNLERFGIKLGLQNVTEFLLRIGNPHRDFKSIHVTGTNGKGSVCAFVSEILRKHGFKVGLYTSPHLVDFRERIKLRGREIPESEVLRLGQDLKDVAERMASEDMEKQLTFFEFTTALAFKYFSEKRADVVVAEVGMGGRLDATNVLVPEVAAVTRVGLEHTRYLGATIQEIAREKAGIVKDGIPVVTCERRPDALAVIASTCRKRKAKLRVIGKDFEVSNVRVSMNGTAFDYSGQRRLRGLRVRLLGGFQAENAAAAIAIAEELAGSGLFVTDDAIRRGLMSARWPGRLDIVSRKPLVIFDGGHNPDGVEASVRALEQLGATPLTFVLGCMEDKDARGIVKALAPHAAAIISTSARSKRALPADRLDAIVSEEFHGPRGRFAVSEEALAYALEHMTGRGVCVIGSLYLVGEAMRWWGDRHGPAHKV